MPQPEIVLRDDGLAVLRTVTETPVGGDLEKFLVAKLTQNTLLLTPSLGPVPELFADALRLAFSGSGAFRAAAFRLTALNFHAIWRAEGGTLRPAFLERGTHINPGAAAEGEGPRKLLALLPPWQETWFVYEFQAGMPAMPGGHLVTLVLNPAWKPGSKQPRLRTHRLPLPNVHSNGSLCMGEPDIDAIRRAGGLIAQSVAGFMQWVHSPWNDHLLNRELYEAFCDMFGWTAGGDQLPSTNEAWWNRCPICAPGGAATLVLTKRVEEINANGSFAAMP